MSTGEILHPAPTSTASNRLLGLAVCGLGISALITQLTLMRELLSIFAGNELIFGIVLGNWMLLSGLGAALGRTASRFRWPLAALVVGQILLSLLPVADVFLLRTLRNVIFIRGAAIGVGETVASCFLLLAPYCLILGYLLPLASRLLTRAADASGIGRAYFLDNVGMLVGGLLFTFVLVHLPDHILILYFPALLNLSLAVAVTVLALVRAVRSARAVALAVVAAVAAVAVALGSIVCIAVLMAAGDLDELSTRVLYAGQRVVYHGNSPYGSLVVTESAGQLNFIESGVVLFSTGQVAQVEETVHYAMAQRPNARRVLLISGGVSGTAREILKYNRQVAVDYVELDPLILKVAGDYLPGSLPTERIEVINTDGRQFVRQTSRRYDVVILDLPDPTTWQLNRFYTREFFAEVQGILEPDGAEPGGVLCFPLGTYENYLRPELADMIAVAHRTARSEFDRVLMLPGRRVYFLASDGPLTTEVAQRIEQAGVPTRVMNRHYLQATLAPDRLRELDRAITEEAPLNEDFNPILYYHCLRDWFSQFSVHLGVVVVALLVLAMGMLLVAVLVVVLVMYLGQRRNKGSELFFPCARKDRRTDFTEKNSSDPFFPALRRALPVGLVIFTGGLAASALEVVLLIGVQVLYGSAYHQVALIVMMFMLGLAVGSLAINRWVLLRTGRKLACLALGIAAFAVCVPWALGGLEQLGGSASLVASQAAVPLMTLLLAVLVGMQFPLAGALGYADAAQTAAWLYLADYAGAALGALLVSTLLIPVLGVTAVCLLAAGLNVIAAVVIFISPA